MRRSCAGLFLFGSSPRVRGTRSNKIRSRGCFRFIPAGAGNAFTRRLSILKIPVHPRGCGERGIVAKDGQRGLGSSPRVRGTQVDELALQIGTRFIPAGAGNASAAIVSIAAMSVHPRGCGER